MKKIFGIDYRALGVFRILLATLLLIDLLRRLQDFTAHYTENGILPLSLAKESFPHTTSLSLNFLFSSWHWQLFLFCAAIVFSISLLIGFQTRLTSMACWVLTVSIQARNGMILYGVDDLLRVMLFWAMFLPLDTKWAIGQKPKERFGNYFSWVSFAVLIQISMIYLFSALHKAGGIDWNSGQALYYIFNTDEFISSAGHFFAISHLPEMVLFFATYLVLAFELVTPFLLVSPVFFTQLRIVGLVLLLTLHLGIAVFMNLVLFPYVSVAFLTLLIPSKVWDSLGSALAIQKRESALDENKSLESAAILFIAFFFIWNFSELPQVNFQIITPIKTLAYELRLDQSWQLFSEPGHASRWYIFSGTTKDGAQVDVWNNYEHAPDWSEPQNMLSYFKDERWGTYMRGSFDGIWKEHRYPLSQYFCDQWNHDHSSLQKVTNLGVYMAKRPTELHQNSGSPKISLLWNYECKEAALEPPRVVSN